MKPDDIFDPEKRKIIHREKIEKFIARVEAMLYGVCAPNYNEAKEVLETCMKKLEERKKERGFWL